MCWLTSGSPVIKLTDAVLMSGEPSVKQPNLDRPRRRIAATRTSYKVQRCNALDLHRGSGPGERGSLSQFFSSLFPSAGASGASKGAGWGVRIASRLRYLFIGLAGPGRVRCHPSALTADFWDPRPGANAALMRCPSCPRVRAPQNEASTSRAASAIQLDTRTWPVEQPATPPYSVLIFACCFRASWSFWPDPRLCSYLSLSPDAWKTQRNALEGILPRGSEARSSRTGSRPANSQRRGRWIGVHVLPRPRCSDSTCL